MQRTFIRTWFVAGVIGVTTLSCSSNTSPATRALDGPWTTGHSCLALGLNLSWTTFKVDGDGTYRTDVGPVSCTKPPALESSGTVALDATRLSAASLSGTMTFDGGTQGKFTGTLTQDAGGARIDGSVAMPDGTTATVTLIEGLVP
jgi:hypothetical protein